MVTPQRESVPPGAAELFRERLARGETPLGCFLSLGSAQIAELIAAAGYDWALIDLEHGAGDERDTLSQMQALAARGCIAIVRVESTARQRVHRVLDFGAHGIMFPRIESAEEAKAAIAAMRYPPAGVRGVALANRACSWGSDFRAYLEGSNSLLAVIQIESPHAVENAEAIAAVDGVDVLFIGPSDLSHSMGRFGDFEHPDFLSGLRRTAQAALSRGKHGGILLPNPKDLKRYVELGFHFVAAGSDAGLLNAGARSLLRSLRKELDGSRQHS
jgi:4-hydroxy-2-oxoheptanedioate aldolase